MAYLFPEPSHLPAVVAPAPPSGKIAPSSSHFTSLEWSVVVLGRKDGLSTIRQPSRVSVMLDVLFGARQNPRLADPRLEALRRMTVLSRHHGSSIHEREFDAFVSAGYTLSQYELVAASAGSSRQLRKSGKS